jgi:hypothetical protein
MIHSSIATQLCLRIHLWSIVRQFYAVVLAADRFVVAYTLADNLTFSFELHAFSVSLCGEGMYCVCIVHRVGPFPACTPQRWARALVWCRGQLVLRLALCSAMALQNCSGHGSCNSDTGLCIRDAGALIHQITMTSEAQLLLFLLRSFAVVCRVDDYQVAQFLLVNISWSNIIEIAQTIKLWLVFFLHFWLDGIERDAVVPGEGIPLGGSYV